MSYSNYQLNQRINNLQNQINNAPIPTLQSVLNSGNSALSQSIELTNGTSASTLNNTTLNFSDNAGSSDLTYSSNILNINGQVEFNTPPHSVTPILGNDITTKDYVDSLVGQYSGGFNLFLNYSQSVVVNSISYKSFSPTVSSASNQIVSTITDGTNQLIASFISDPINILEIPTGLWNMALNGGVSSAGGVLNYFFKIRRNRAGVISDLITSGNSPDINATPSSNPDTYHMNATISTAIPLLLTDRIIIEIYCIKTSGASVTLNTYFEGDYYSYIQTTLNAGTTLLSSSNNWTGSNIFNNNVRLNSTLTDTSGSVGLLGQYLASSASGGVSWITPPITGTTYISYTSSITLPTLVNSTFLIIFSGSTASQTLTIPASGYPVGQIIQIKNRASVNVSISSPITGMLLYGISAPASTYTLIPEDSYNLYFNGFAYIQYTPSNTFTKIVGSNGCLAGQTNYVSINTSALPQTVSTVINTDMFVLLTGSTALQILSIPVVSNIGQRITVKNRASVDVSLSFPSSNVLLFDSLSETGITAVILKSKGTISFYWGGTYWIQTVPSNAMPELTTSGNITTSSGNISASAGSVSASTTVSAGTTITAGTGITATTGNISASAGSISASTTISAGTTITAGTGITATTGNISASAGSVSASTTVSAGTTITAGTGITATTGNISASAGSVSASTTISAGTTITAGTGITATTGNIVASAGSLSAFTSVITPTITPIANTTNLGICTLQTTGILNIATGPRTKTSGTGEGNINIGTGINTITSGTTAPTINIGNNTSTLNVTEISIGATNTITTINGPLTLTGAATVASISGSGLFTTSGNIQTSGTGGFSATGSGDIQTSSGKVKTGTLDAVSAGALNIGTSTATSINMSSAGNTTTIKGPVTASEGLTLGSSQYITTSHTGTITIPTSLQVGYTQSVSYSLPTVPTTLNLITMNSITLAQGVWILKGAVSITASTSITYGFVSFGDTSRPSAISPVTNDSLYGSVSFNGVPTATNEKVIPNLITYVSPTTSTTYYFNIYLVGSGSGYNSQNWRLQGIRIA